MRVQKILGGLKHAGIVIHDGHNYSPLPHKGLCDNITERVVDISWLHHIMTEMMPQ